METSRFQPTPGHRARNQLATHRGLVCYLGPDAAGFTTNTDIVIDGGWTAE